MATKRKIIFILLTVALLLVIVFSLGLGSMSIPSDEVVLILLKKIGLFRSAATEPVNEGVVTMLRLPRVMLSILVGAALGISGAAIQGIFRNPLAEPGLMGISAGASLLAVAIIALEALFAGLSHLLGYSLLAVGAFAGAALASALVYHLSKTNGKTNIAMMLLAGIAVNAFAGALTGLMTYLASEQQLRTITFWMLGSLGGATWENVTAVAPFILLAVLALPFFAKGLNLFAIGESQTDLIGLNANRIKVSVIILATMAVGASVSVSGVIGFVGLLVPHMVRLTGGVDHRFVLPASALAGALVLTLADLVARLVIQPIELPIGVVTALLGTPLFLHILIKEKKKVANI